MEYLMLIPGVPLEVRVEQPDHSYIIYGDINLVPEPAKTKALTIINSPIRVSKITIKLA